ncbi:ankyrin repeat domain-containing protein [Ideonella sp. B7]|uniref:ankyrin repeat domain-containing protein n=1 Tax=Ideonella benzenivorans TaxID=2831643 RepID=UPI001CED51CB|nr:ankyrin repeat domain-containing protein [Ideonella benzenivorans]MCA6218667.1 ankyrin repeat domain-containing protein [Ideonella benzenivorans]
MNDHHFQRLTPAQAGAWLQARPDALILDAREARHHAMSHLAGCTRLDGRNHETLLMRERKSRPVFIYCYHGNASQTWAGMFTDFGFTEVADLIGGWSAVDGGGRLYGPQPLEAVFPPATPAPAAGPVPAELATWLAANGFDPGQPAAPGPHGNTPLMHAAWRGAHHTLDALLALDVPLDATNGDGNNALWLACVNGEPGLIRALAAHGVPLDHANLTGATALMYAASAGKAEVVATLLALGADPHRRTQDDFSALDMAATIECLRLLRSATRQAA